MASMAVRTVKGEKALLAVFSANRHIVFSINVNKKFLPNKLRGKLSLKECYEGFNWPGKDILKKSKPPTLTTLNYKLN
jgi:hypothetical protein